MVYLIQIRDNEGRGRYLKSDGTWTEYWQDAEEFITRKEAKDKAKRFNRAKVLEFDNHSNIEVK